MKISAINNSYSANNNRSFNGTFVKNDEIQSFVKGASYDDKMRFKNILKRMDEVDDDYLYYLKKNVYINEADHDMFMDYDERYTVDTGYELYQQKGADTSTRKHIGGFEDDGWFAHKLREVCDRLEEIYPQKTTKRASSQLDYDIFEMMLKPKED